ncbi:hypothetical protein [Tengunoibacter tsumagoiensis]|uniref:Uncharacterized protein n=1 Tax=Tengunoibacter tsumagoiensis TaxID=2014871 RepID=A0A402A4G1_9CHLR|nr:hypothetical protein [Tengunoibacter tsumagoiensis]GCE13946.1 hypothetical protein KTT_38050 [Tengunoibacter tsumagoiensis]
MTTTGELRAIIEELELEDIGDAASYLGEESAFMDGSTATEAVALTFTNTRDYLARDDRWTFPVL